MELSRHIKKQSIYLVLTLVLLFSPRLSSAEIILHVGFTNNKPVVFTSDKGEPQGVYIDVLDHIAKQEGWIIEYQSNIWDENLRKLQAGEIDLLLDIAYTAERSHLMSFSNVSLLEDWARVFVKPDVVVTDFADLTARKVGLVRDDIHTNVFLQIVKFLGVEPVVVFTESYAESMDLFVKGKIDVMVLPSLQEKKLAEKVAYLKSDILFNPVELRFAAPLGTNLDILERIDYHVALLKDKPSSMYHKSMTKWVEGVQRMVLPRWLSPSWVISGVVGLILVVSLFIILLRKQVRVQTRALATSISLQQKQESELSVAKDIQLGLLPELSFSTGDYELSAFLEPAKMVGGDFFDFFTLSRNRLCFLIADVADKGVPAALFMAATKTCLTVTAKDFKSVDQLMTSVNEVVSENNPRCMFVTMFCGVLDLETGALSYTLAGHDPPYLQRENGDLVILNKAHCMALGLDEDAEYEQADIRIFPGDTLFMFTDGVSEAINSKGKQFGEDEIKVVLDGVRGQASCAVISAVKDKLRCHVGKTPAHDDITMFCLRRQA